MNITPPLISAIVGFCSLVVAIISLFRAIRSDRRSKTLAKELTTIHNEHVQMKQTIAEIMLTGRGGNGGSGGRGGEIILSKGSTLSVGNIASQGGAGGKGGNSGGIEKI